MRRVLDARPNLYASVPGAVAHPKGLTIDMDEPRRVAEAVATLKLKHAVVTSVNRDDDNIGAAEVFAETIRQIRELTPDCQVEVLIPIFKVAKMPENRHRRQT